jgi:hypothetical protein
MTASSLVRAAALLACGPTKKSGKVRRPAKHASPEKRVYAGKATTSSIGLARASSLDRNYLGAALPVRGGRSIYRTRGTTVFFARHRHGDRRRERRAPEARRSWMARKHSSISLKRSREIESVFKRGAFALVDASDALGKSKRDASTSLLSTSTQKERAIISLVEAVEAE